MAMKGWLGNTIKSQPKKQLMDEKYPGLLEGVKLRIDPKEGW